MGRPRVPRRVPRSSRINRVSTPARSARQPEGTIDDWASRVGAETSLWAWGWCRVIAALGCKRCARYALGVDAGSAVFPGRI